VNPAVVHPVLKIGKSRVKLGLLFSLAAFLLLLPLACLFLILAGDSRDAPVPVLIFPLAIPVIWLLLVKPGVRLARCPDPLITLGPQAVTFHHSGDTIPYDRILAVCTQQAKYLTYLKLRLKPGPAVMLKSLRIPFLHPKLENIPEDKRWDLAQLAAFALPAEQIAAEITQRVPALASANRSNASSS
jgi:hypothetical protein